MKKFRLPEETDGEQKAINDVFRLAYKATAITIVTIAASGYFLHRKITSNEK